MPVETFREKSMYEYIMKQSTAVYKNENKISLVPI